MKQEDLNIDINKALANPSSESIHRRYCLNIVANRLRRINELSRRMTIEKPQILLDQYIPRLTKRKKELREQFKKATRLPKQMLGASTHLYTPPTATIGYAVPGLFDLSRGYPVYKHGGGAFLQPRTIEGYESQRTTFWRDETVYITHNSMYGFDEDTTNFAINGDRIISQWLDDDASIWRDDNPDCYITHLFTYWILPTPRLSNVHVTCGFLASQYLEFSNSADDGGGFSSGISLCRYDSDNPYLYMIWQTMGNWLESLPSGKHQSRTFISSEFDVIKGSEVYVLGGHHVRLWAQDGRADVSGTLGVDGGRVPNQPLPELWYSMVPI